MLTHLRTRLAAAGLAIVLAAGFAAAQGATRSAAPQTRPASEPGADGWPVQEQLDLQYSEASRDARRNRLDLYLPQGMAAPPLVVFVHGGTWIAGSKEGHAFIGRALARAGIACATINYRLFPFARWPAFAEDCAAAFAWLHGHAAENGFDRERMFLMGHSAGGQIAGAVAFDAAWLGAHGLHADVVKGFLGLSGVYDVRPWLELLANIFGRDIGVRTAASPIVHAGSAAPPSLLRWAEHDLPNLDLSARMLAAKLRELGVPVDSAELRSENHVGYLFRLGGANDVLLPAVQRFVHSRCAALDRADPARALPRTEVEVQRDLRYAGPESADHVLDLYRPKDGANAPLLLFVHGGFWTGGDKRDAEPLARAFAAQGLAVAVMNYRLAPQHRHPAQVQDVAQSFAWLHARAPELGCDPQRMYLAGHDAGAQLADLVALDPQWLAAAGAPSAAVRAVVSLSAPCDLRPQSDLFGAAFPADAGAEAKKLASPIAHVRADAPPMLLLWAEHDDHRLATDNRAMAAQLELAGQRHVALELCGHDHGSYLGDLGGEQDELSALVFGFLGL